MPRPTLKPTVLKLGLYAKSAFEAYVSELTKVSDLFTSATKETFAPLQGRVQAWVEVVQSARAV